MTVCASPCLGYSSSHPNPMCYFSAHLLIQPSLALPALHSLLSWSSACTHCLYFSPVCFCVCCVFSLTGWLNKSSRARQSSPVVHLPHPAGTLVSRMWLSLIRSQEGEVTVVIPEYPLHACSGHFGATQAWVKCWLHCLLGVFPWMSNLTTLKFTFFFQLLNVEKITFFLLLKNKCYQHILGSSLWNISFHV